MFIAFYYDRICMLFARKIKLGLVTQISPFYFLVVLMLISFKSKEFSLTGFSQIFTSCL